MLGIEAVCFDWGGTLMSEDGPEEIPMALWPQVRAIPGAAECLASLAGRWPLCIATNASVSRRPMIVRALERVGFAGYFHEIYCYTELGCRKSDPRFWQAVQASLKLPPERIAMIGDSLEQDALAPRSFGVQAVWFNEGGRRAGAPPGLPVITRLEQFAGMIRCAAPPPR